MRVLDDSTLQEMTVDELDELSVEYKSEINGLRDERRRAKAIRDRKVLVAAVAAQNKVDPADLTDEEIETLIDIARRVPASRNPGDVSVAPGAGDLRLRGENAEVD